MRTIPEKAILRPPASQEWLMAPDQRRLFWRLWAAVCHCQAWNRLPVVQREQRRHEILAELGFSTAKRIDKGEGFDRVKRRLEELADKVHVQPADAGRRARILWRINRAMGRLRAAGYPERAISTILKERFKVVAGLNTVPDLPSHELVNLSRTLTARLASWQRRQGAQASQQIAILQSREPVLPQNGDLFFHG